MPSGTIYGTTANQYIQSKIDWSYTSDIASNTSTVTAKLYYRRTNTGYTTGGTGSFTITINNTTESTSGVSLSISTDWVLAMTATVAVPHNDDGTKTITISATGSLPPSTLTETDCSGSVTLNTIARASEPTVSESSVVMLDSVTITTNRKNSSFTHTLTYSFGGSTGTIAADVGESYEWTVPDLVSKISGKSSGTCTITCKTYSGSVLVGTKTVSLTLNIPAESRPSASEAHVKMGATVILYTNRESAGFTHTLTYTMGDASGTIGLGVGSGRAWAVPKSLAAYTGNKTTALCTITCKTYNGTLLVGTATTRIALEVPDATVPTLSASTVAMGSKITVSMDKEVDVYTHSLAYSLKEYGASTEIAAGSIDSVSDGDYEWTVPLSLAAEIPADTKATVTVICKTWLGETLVGTEAVSFTATVPNNSTTAPQFTMTLSPVSDLPSVFDDVYVAGKSSVQVSYEATSDYSTIASYLTALLGSSNSGTANPYTSPVLVNSGTVTVAGQVTDARGYSNAKKEYIEVIPYSRPRIIPGENKSQIVCTRCNSDGTADPGGVYLLIKIGRKYEKVVSGDTQKNYCKVYYRYKTDAQDDSEYSAPVELLSRTATSDYVTVTLGGIVSSTTTAYNIQIIAEDDVGEKDTVTVTVPTAFVTFHSPVGGRGFTLGGYHDPAKVDVFDCRFDAEFQGNVTGMVLGLGGLPKIPESADLDEYKSFGAWAVATDAIAASIANIPAAKKGTLRVWAANGCTDDTENGIYVLQEYICFDNSASYRRSIQCPTQDGAWEYGSWMVSIWQSI